jgi:hypothetical protein
MARVAVHLCECVGFKGRTSVVIAQGQAWRWREQESKIKVRMKMHKGAGNVITNRLPIVKQRCNG